MPQKTVLNGRSLLRHIKWLFPQPVQVEKSVGDGLVLIHVVEDDKFKEQSAVWRNGEILISKGKPISGVSFVQEIHHEYESLLRKNGIMNSMNRRGL